jgi:hypothetical protein
MREAAVEGAGREGGDREDGGLERLTGEDNSRAEFNTTGSKTPISSTTHTSSSAGEADIYTVKPVK